MRAGNNRQHAVETSTNVDVVMIAIATVLSASHPAGSSSDLVFPRSPFRRRPAFSGILRRNWSHHSCEVHVSKLDVSCTIRYPFLDAAPLPYPTQRPYGRVVITGLDFQVLVRARLLFGPTACHLPEPPLRSGLAPAMRVGVGDQPTRFFESVSNVSRRKSSASSWGFRRSCQSFSRSS